MSVILLVDGLPLVYAGTAGWGQVTRDDAKATRLFHDAANKGVRQAQYAMAMRHIHGIGGAERDAAKAYFWALLASAQGVEEAATIRDAFEKLNTLSPGDRERIQKEAIQWKPQD